MKAGYGAVDITPPPNTELGGYGYYLNRRARTVIDPLYARAVVLSEGNEKLAVISVDIVQLSDAVVEALHHSLQDRYRPDQIMLVATHTHTAPVAGTLEGCGLTDRAYVAALPGRIKEAVEAAEADLSKVEAIQTSQARAGDVAFNRVRPEGPVDDFVRGLFMRRGGRRPVAMVHFACHPVTLGRVEAISADYPGRVVKCLSENGTDALFLNGLCGDIDPVSNKIAWGSGTEATIEQYGQKIADAFESALTPANSSGWTLKTARMALTLRNLTIDGEWIDGQVRQLTQKLGESAAEVRVARAWAEKMRRANHPSELASEEFEASVAALGPVVLAAIPYEAYTRTGALIREALPDKMVLVMGCSERTRGYLPTADEFEKGSYGALASAFLYLRPPVLPGEAEAIGRDLGARIARWLHTN